MLDDKIVLTQEDIVLLSVLVESQLKLDNQQLSFFLPGCKHYKQAQRLMNEISVLSDLQNKLKSIKSITYDKK